MTSQYSEQLLAHYAKQWQCVPMMRRWECGPVNELPGEFCVVECAPTARRSMWTYGTCCMSQLRDDSPLELHLFSPERSHMHIELLTVVAHYHWREKRIGLHDTVNFGRGWLPESHCDHGLVSLPYLDGPTLEWIHVKNPACTVRFLWLIPITRAEVEYKKLYGVEALERRLEQARFNYVDPYRPSVVSVEMTR